MKAYFTASIVGRNKHINAYKTTVRELEKHGIKVQADHILESDSNALHNATPTQRLRFHKQLEDWIHESDIVVANVSYPSISVGYEIAMALNQNKPVLALYEVGTKPPNLLVNYKNDWVVCEAYSQTTLPEIIDEFIRFAQSRTEMRFTFFLSPSQAAHLEHVSRHHNTPKSVYLRNLIEQDMAPHRS